jgi:hypothetical protein
MFQWNCQRDCSAAFPQGNPAKTEDYKKTILGGIMSSLSSASANISRRAFRNLLVVWAMFVLATLVIVMAFGATKAHAMEPLPFPKITREIAPPVYTSFSKVPSQSVAADRCQSLLNKVQLDTRSNVVASTRRSAGQPQADMVKITAIKAYRQCMSQTALQELAVWRWSR